MSSSRLLDFFVLEATDYIDRLDELLSAPDGQPDAASLTAQARLLRGSATMARQSPIADLASALERIGRAVRDDIIAWTPELHAALIAAVDDLKILVRAVRSWGAGNDRRTESRISELVALYPQATKTHPTPPSTVRNSSFIASESAQLASALDNLAAHPSAVEALAVAMHRLSSLRGVAAINDSPPLARVLTSLDDVLRPLHLRNALPETQHIGVLTSAVQLLRRFSQEIAIGGTLDANSPLVHEFTAAVGGLSRQESGGQDAVIPIARLNFEDGQPQLVSTTRQPLPSVAQRFRLEIAGPCEFLRHQVSLARASAGEMERNSAAAEMRASLRVLRSAADGFGDSEVAAFIDAIEPGVSAPTLALIDEMARALLNESLDIEAVHSKLREMLHTRAAPPPAATPAPARAPTPAPPRAPTPAQTHTVVSEPPRAATWERPRAPTPAPVAAPVAPARRAPATPMAGAGLSEMLSAGIAGLAALDVQPLSEPAPIEEEAVVPIEQLLYRGRGAISRALEIRDEIRARAGVPATEELDELFELLDLAVTE